MAQTLSYSLLTNSEDLLIIQQLFHRSRSYLQLVSSNSSSTQDVINQNHQNNNRHHSHFTNNSNNSKSSSFTTTLSPSHYLLQLKEQHSNSPILQLFFDLLLPACTNSNKYGWLCIYFSTHLILTWIQSDGNKSQLLVGYQYAYSLVQKELHNPNSPLCYKFHWSDHSTVLSLIYSLLNDLIITCSLSIQDRNHIASCLLEAFITSLTETSEQKFLPNILFYSIPSVSPSQMSHYPGTVILDIPIPHLFPTNPLKDIFIAVFESSIEIMTNNNIQVEIDMTPPPPSQPPQHPHPPQSSTSSLSTAPITSAKNAEYQILNSMCEIIVNSNVQVLCCQKRIHPYLQQLLRRKGILCLPRLSILHINKILALSGAKQLGAFSSSLEVSSTTQVETLHLPSLGFINSLFIDYIGGKKVLVLQSLSQQDDEITNNTSIHKFSCADSIYSRRCLMSTITICGWHQNQITEIQQCCESVIRILTMMIQSDQSTVLPGGGCWIQYLVRVVKQTLVQQINEMKLNSTVVESKNKIPCGVINGARLYCEILEKAALLLDGSASTSTISSSHQDLDHDHNDSFILPFPTSTSTSSSTGIMMTTFQSPSGQKTVALSKKNNEVQTMRVHNRKELSEDGQEEEQRDEDEEEEEEGYIVSSDSLDSFHCCNQTIQLSLEAVNCILDIDGLIILKEQSDDDDDDGN